MTIYRRCESGHNESIYLANVEVYRACALIQVLCYMTIYRSYDRGQTESVYPANLEVYHACALP